MKLAVISHKPCWASAASPTGFATDGGFAFQMAAISQIFEETALLVPILEGSSRPGEVPIGGDNIRIIPLTNPAGRNFSRKLCMPAWLAWNVSTILRHVRQSDVVHTPIPGDVGTIGMLAAWLLRKPLLVRHCGNWLQPRTTAERFWKWFMEQTAGGRNVMLATGGSPQAPSRRNPHVRWIFSTSLWQHELTALGEVRSFLGTRDPRIIIACRQENAKGTGLIIEGLEILLERWPGAVLDVVGDGSALAYFKEVAASRNLSDRVIFHGKVGHERVLELLKSATLFCFPTQSSEGFPKAVLEALACGLPVVTTRVSVLPQLIEQGCGVLLDGVTPAEVASAIGYCLSDAVRYRSMSERALKVAQSYSLERWRDQISDLLRAAG